MRRHSTLFTLALTLSALTACSSNHASSGSGSSGTGGGGGAPPVVTKLPPLPELENLHVRMNGDAANVTFNPVDAAADYRIYPLPADNDITLNPDGTIVVKDAIYRCAGAREALYMLVDDPQTNDNSAGGTTILNGDVEGFMRKEADATLGYVYTAPGDGRTPVYVLGNGGPDMDGNHEVCGRPLFHSTRQKTYTTDPKTRDTLLAAHARDDGIAFYVPAAGANTIPVYEGTPGQGNVLRWVDGPEGTARMGQGKAIFNVLKAQEAGTAPLQRIYVAPYCGKGHDELVAGMARHKKVRTEGDQPLTALHWAGLDKDTVLVVEALDHGCPYQGHLSPEHVDAFTDTGIDYPAYLTIDDTRKASATGEVFVNGQYDGVSPPKAIARSFIHGKPEAAPAMDFYAGFPGGSMIEAFTDVGGEMWVDKHLQSPTYDLTTYANSKYILGAMLGELWVAYSDVGADVGGKIRLTPRAKASIGAGTFLHVTMEVDMVSSDRRYPQIMISDQDAPVQEKLATGKTLVIQPKGMSPTWIQVQVCDHRNWDVNDQCPLLPTIPPDFLPPGLMPGELVGVDRTVKFDAYVSNERVYVLLDDVPYSCTNLPSKADDGMVHAMPTGAVTVTFGDVLYHSGVDLDYVGMNYQFHKKHMQVMTRRHFDNLGWKSGVAAPTWDEGRLPCATGM